MDIVINCSLSSYHYTHKITQQFFVFFFVVDDVNTETNSGQHAEKKSSQL